MLFVRTAVRTAAFGAVGYGLIQGAGELGQLSTDNSASSGASAGENVIACINAASGGDSDFMYDDKGLIIGIDLIPADRNQPMFGDAECDPIAFGGQVVTIPEILKTDADGLLTAANNGLSGAAEQREDTREGDYQTGAFAIIALGTAIKKRRSIYGWVKGKFTRDRSAGGSGNDEPPAGADWSGSPC